MISKKNSQMSHLEQKKKKRVKGSEAQQERNFKCFCGKTYLSYPALYLHKKLKHSGQNEDQESKNNPTVDSQQHHENEKAQEQHSQDSALEELIVFVKSCKESFVIKDGENNDISNPQVQKKYIGYFPYDWFEKKEDFQPLVLNLQQIYENLTETGEFEEDDVDEEQDIKTTKCNKIFALFLAKLSKHLTIDGFKEIAYFITLFRLTLNRVGWKSIKNQSEIQYGKEYCAEQSGEYCLEACNDFIISQIPAFLKSCPHKDFHCVDAESMGKSVKLTQYFSAWLFDNNYTHSKLLLSKDD